MGQKPPVVSVSKLIEALRCPRCAWFMIHRGVKFADDHQAATLRNKHLIRKQYDRARRNPGIPHELGWPRAYWPGAVLFASQDVADRLRYRMQYFDKKNGFSVRGQIDDAIFVQAEHGYIPIKIAFPGSEDREIGKLEQARFDEAIRLMRECGFRILGYAVKISYLLAPGFPRIRIPGLRCKIAAVDGSDRRSNRLHRLIKTIINLKNPPSASEDCARHRLVHEEARLLRARH